MNQTVLCQTIECIQDKGEAELLHKDTFELRCFRCVPGANQRKSYYEIRVVSKSCKQQLTNAANNIQSNITDLIKKIINYFKDITKNIKEIEKKIYSIIEQFTLPSDCVSYLRGQDNDIRTLSNIIKKYFQPSNEIDQDNGISFKEAFKNQLVIPKRIQQSLLKLDKMLSDFVQEIYNDNLTIIQPLPLPYPQPPSPDPIAPPSKPTINIMNQQNAQRVPTKNSSFVLKSKQTFNLKGLQFGEGSDNEQINIIIKDEEGQEILNEDRIKGRNMQIIFKKPIKFQENKEYTIEISKNAQINLMIYKVKQQNDYVEVLSDSTPIDALLI